MINDHSAKLVGRRYYVRGVIMFLVVKEEDSACSRFNPPLLFISKVHGLKSLKSVEKQR